MDINVGDYIYVVESLGKETYLMEGTVEKINPNVLILKPFQDDSMKEFILLPKEFYPKQKNINITKNLDEAKLIYLAKKFRRFEVIDTVDAINISEEINVTDIIQEIEKSKISFPELWI